MELVQFIEVEFGSAFFHNKIDYAALGHQESGRKETMLELFQACFESAKLVWGKRKVEKDDRDDTIRVSFVFRFEVRGVPDGFEWQAVWV